jgi:hypothetical protein
MSILMARIRSNAKLATGLAQARKSELLLVPGWAFLGKIRFTATPAAAR